MSRTTCTILLRYGGAVVLSALAVVLRLLFDPLLEDRLPYLSVFAALIVTAWLGGRGPALLSLFVGALATSYFVVPPRFSFALGQIEYRVGLTPYVIVGLALIALVELLHKKGSRLELEVKARHVAEQVLADREELLRTAFLSIGDGILTTDSHGNITFLNTAAQELTGWTYEQAHGNPLMMVFQMIDEVSRRPIENPVEKILKLGRIAGKGNESVLIGKHGTERPIDYTGAPIRDAKDSITGVVLIFRDITERKRVEDALRRQEERLRDADRRKDEFLATLAHELRNPLAPIRTSVHLLRLIGPPDPKLNQVREMIERQVTHLIRLVDDLLEVSRITRGKIELQRELVDLSKVVRNAIETSGPLIEAGRHELMLSTPSQPVEIAGDVVRLTQVVTNLLNNSAKFTDPGGQIRVSVNREGGEGVVRVRDNGAGIPADMLTRVFALFTQVEDGHGRSQGGLGIGLALAKGLVEMHGGKIEAHSEGACTGTELVVRLPLAERNGEVEAESVSNGRSVGFTPCRILIVDDNADAAESLSMLLLHNGHEVRTAHDGLTGIEQTSLFNPDVILLDLGMPGMDGFETARRVRQLKGLKQIKIVALTGWGQDEDRRRTKEAGFDAHLVKPVDAATLQELLASISGHIHPGET